MVSTHLELPWLLAGPGWQRRRRLLLLEPRTVVATSATASATASTAAIASTGATNSAS